MEKPFEICRTSVGVSQVVLVINNLPSNSGSIKDTSSIPRLGRSPAGGHGNPLLFPGESLGQRRLVGYDP